ncbi:MAG: FeoA domain-containing protein [Deltaproteobacteria bacterium]|jgi:DtxR family Mn-dependent transcriptional regulator|nr:FeoA domain-containing protein [Deltaproteobacteria bacterium]MBW2534383.1 FeoA domain-containing protein [Deltaproteobacteria bacterium]
MVLSQQKREEILEAIWVADEDGDDSAANVRDHCPEEVSDDELGELGRDDLLERDGERLRLTARGRAKARGVVRRHRLTESLLTYVLKLPQEQAHEIACHMEHILPPEMETSICTLLGHPEYSPEGKPIPPGEDCLERLESVQVQIVNLCEMKPGEQGRIAYIKPKHHRRLHRLSSFGIVPGVVVELHQRTPAYVIKFEQTELALDKDVAEDIFVRRLNERT